MLLFAQWIAALTLAVTAAGCKGAVPVAPLPVAGNDKAAALVAPPPKSGEVRIELIDAGAEPRSLLRYEFRAIRPEKMVFEMEMDIGRPSSGLGDEWMAQPAMRFVSLVEPRQLTPEGDLVYQVVTERVDIREDAAVDSEVRSKMQAQVKPMVGRPTEAVVTSRGIAKRVEVVGPSGASPEPTEATDLMRSMIQQMLVPLPAEVVGVGAKWKATATVQTKAFRFVEVTSCTLVSRDQGGVVVDFEIEERSPGPQKLRLSEAPPDATVILESHEGHGKGRIHIDFSHLVARGEQQSERRGLFKIEMPGQTLDLRKMFRIKYAFAPQ